MKTVYAFFLLVQMVIASEYNIDAIIKAKGENTKQISLDYSIVKDANKADKDVKDKYYHKYTLPAQRAAEEREQRLSNYSSSESVSSSSSSASNAYKCTYMCFNFGGAIGLGHKNLKEYTITLSESSSSKANKRGFKYAKKSCKKMGYSGVHSRWGKGSIDCKKQ